MIIKPRALRYLNRIKAPGIRIALAQLHPSAPLFAAAIFGLVGVTSVFAQEPGSSEAFEKCTAIANDQARLSCLKALIPAPSSTPAASESREWPLVRTPNPKGGRDSVAIMRTADTAQSDPDLAGLMVRCAEQPTLEVLLALVRPFPPRTKRDVVVSSGTAQSVLRAEASSAGMALILPIEASAFTTGPWQAMKELSVIIKDPEADIHGVIHLDGLAAAIARLSANCPSG